MGHTREALENLKELTQYSCFATGGGLEFRGTKKGVIVLVGCVNIITIKYPVDGQVQVLEDVASRTAPGVGLLVYRDLRYELGVRSTPGSAVIFSVIRAGFGPGHIDTEYTYVVPKATCRRLCAWFRLQEFLWGR